jgi:Domain of unknown function (DUF3786)
MPENFLEIQKEYLRKVWLRPTEELEKVLPAQRLGNCFRFRAFGEPCELYPDEIILGGQRVNGPEGILIAMYASHVNDEPLQLNPLRSFKELPHSMPYQGAFSVNAERTLQPYVSAIQKHQSELAAIFSGSLNTDHPSGDFSFTLYPLPRIALYYIFYLPDEEFSASINCLFAANATSLIPVAGLADVAEYTARKIIELIQRQ